MKSARPRPRTPRWRPEIRRAQRLVRAAKVERGKKRYDLLVEAATTLVGLREPRAQRAAFQRAEWALEVAIGKFGCAGCLAMHALHSDKRLYAGVKRAVNEADPIGLLRMGAPRDEYHPEIDDISSQLPHCRTRDETWSMVHRTFVKWFERRTAGPRSSYRALARQLDGLRRTVRLSATSRRWVVERRRLVEEGKIPR